VIVVADSSPIVVLVNRGRIDILPILYGRIVIPPEVAAELSDSKRPVPVRTFIATPPDWPEVRPSTQIEPIPGLHSGETAAIALACELAADQLLIDE
jgi:predicted nucleic acid-binding protein